MYSGNNLFFFALQSKTVDPSQQRPRHHDINERGDLSFADRIGIGGEWMKEEEGGGPNRGRRQ